MIFMRQNVTMPIEAPCDERKVQTIWLKTKFATIPFNRKFATIYPVFEMWYE
jgi:hypothetical protein